MEKKSKPRPQDVMTEEQKETYKKFVKLVGYGWTRKISDRVEAATGHKYSMALIRFVAQGLRNNSDIQEQLLNLAKEAGKPKSKTEFEKQMQKLL